MTDQQSWQELNTRYLSTALAWLRLRLEYLTPREQTSIAPPVRSEAEQAQRRGFLRRAPAPAASVPSIPIVTTKAVLSRNPQLDQYAQELSAMEAQEDELPALVVLCQRLDLKRFERDTLLLCVAMELDTRIASLCAKAQNDASRPYPTFALALALFDDASWDILSPERPLRYWRLIDINQPGAQPLNTSALRADERIVNYVKGLNYLDDRLASLVGPLDVIGQQADLPSSQQQVVEQIVHHWQQFASSSMEVLPVIQLTGSDAASKQLVAYKAVASLDRHLNRIPVELLPTQATDIEILARLWQRESLLLPLALYLDMQDVENTVGEALTPHLNRFLVRSDGVFFLGTREMWPRLGRASAAFDVAKPTTQEQYASWAGALGTDAEDNPALLAGQFDLNQPTIQRIAQAELREPAEHATPLSERLWNACLLSARPGLDMLAQRLALKASWEDLVLPKEEKDALRQLAAQVKQRIKVYEDWGFARKMNRGLGINALFAGESGVGKTMAAEVIANDLRLNLYRIDLSSVVSKYIGETEKNLRRLFDAAEGSGAILLFDEADALFGKRSEVKDSHDRYANIEISYLLQRIEAYKGLAILATNMMNALDTAFMRRLRFIVRFSFPGPAERRLIWEKVFPPDTPLEALDYDRLARFNLAGGSIQNIALNAAFMAAHAGTPVCMSILMDAARVEFRKLDRPIIENDFKLPIMQGART
jgi:hypothetical protein